MRITICKLLIVSALIAVMLWAPGKTLATNYNYTARTAESVRTTGRVKVGNLYWYCKQKQCTITGPWSTPNAKSCYVLAQQVGIIVYYGHAGAQLTSTELGECNGGRSLADETLDVPLISAPVEEAFTESVRDNLPPVVYGGKELVSTLGPQIVEFSATDGCPYPGRDMAALRYRVNAALDGAPVTRIDILQVLDDGSTRPVYETPEDDGRSIRASASDIRDSGPGGDVVRYMLRATANRNRRSTQVIPTPYWAGIASLTLGPSFEVTRDGSAYRYRIPYEANHVTISARPEVSVRFYADRRSVTADIVGGASLTQIFSDGVEGGFSPSGVHYRQPVRGNIYFTSREAIFPDGRIEFPSYGDSATNPLERWSINVRLPLATPASCEGSTERGISRSLSGDIVARGEDPVPAPAGDYTGYLWDIPCACEEPYNDDATRTRAFTALIRGCMANERGAALYCGFAAPRLEPIGAAGRYCTALAPPARVDDGPLSCFAVPGSIVILENNRNSAE